MAFWWCTCETKYEYMLRSFKVATNTWKPDSVWLIEYRYYAVEWHFQYEMQLQVARIYNHFPTGLSIVCMCVYCE